LTRLLRERILLLFLQLLRGSLSCEPFLKEMFALLISVEGQETYGPGLTMAPGYIQYGPGFIDCMPVHRVPASDAHGYADHGMRAINTESGRHWVAGEKWCGTAGAPLPGTSQ